MDIYWETSTDSHVGREKSPRFLSIGWGQVPHSLQIPVVLFSCRLATSTSFYESWKALFWLPCPGRQRRGAERSFRGLPVLWLPELTARTQASQPGAVKRGLWAARGPQTCLVWPTVYMEFCQHFLNQQISAKNSEQKYLKAGKPAIIKVVLT